VRATVLFMSMLESATAIRLDLEDELTRLLLCVMVLYSLFVSRKETCRRVYHDLTQAWLYRLSRELEVRKMHRVKVSSLCILN
jgi:hypothetical protein